MYVLDTNAFYYAAGISTCTYNVEKLRKLIRENDTFISTTSLYEFLIRFRDDITTIHKGGKHLWKNKIKLASNVFNPLPDNFTGDLMNITQNELNELCHKILANKIDIESRLITILFDMCLLSGYYFSAMSSGKEPSSFCFEVLEKVSRMFTEINLEVLVNIFTEAYKTVDCENFIRDSFIICCHLTEKIWMMRKKIRNKGFNNDEELAMYDLLFRTPLTERLKG